MPPHGMTPSAAGLQRWCRAETPSQFISHLCGRAWSNEIKRKMGGIERETMVILALTHSTRDLMLLSTRVLQSKCIKFCNNYRCSIFQHLVCYECSGGQVKGDRMGVLLCWLNYSNCDTFTGNEEREMLLWSRATKDMDLPWEGSEVSLVKEL